MRSPFSPYEGEAGLPEPETIEEATDLFEPYQEEGSPDAVLRFYTKDSRYRGTSGYTLWTYRDEAERAESEAEVYKTLGSDTAGYGLVVYSEERPVKGKAERVFMTVMINNSGQYAAGKVTGTRYTALVPWTAHEALESGRGARNRIQVVADGEEANRYELYFNGRAAGYFLDGTQPFCGGRGRSGYVVVLAPEDLNGGGAVEVFFRE
jgi:hypothetical protein